MNETLNILQSRRSCRAFKPDMVEQEKLDAIIKAGTFAATGRGKQSPIIVAVTNKEMRDKISEENRKIGGWDEGFDPFYGAPVILIVLADKNVSTYKYDGSLVMGNLLNAAESVGVNSIWIHRAKEEFESDFGKKILEKLGIKGDYEGIGHYSPMTSKALYTIQKPVFCGIFILADFACQNVKMKMSAVLTCIS